MRDPAYLRIDQAAARSGLHPVTIQRLVRQGKLEGYKQTRGTRRGWRVGVRSLDYYTDPIDGLLLYQPGPKVYLERQAVARRPN